MSNDLILSIKNRLATLPAGVDDDTRAVAGAGSGGGGSKRISIKGGVFRKIVNGKEVGNIEDRHMNVIFVKMAHDPARTFYSQGYQDGVKVSPVCWSSNSKTPDPEVKKPQASSCDTCPHSVKGSGQGGMGTACRLQWRTAVVLPDNPGGDVLQLVLPATSAFGKEQGGRWPFRPYVQMLANANLSARRVITKMQFDTKSPVPKVLFSPVDAVNPEDEEVIRQQAESTEAENAIKLTVFQQDEGEAAVAAPVVEAQAPAEEGGEPALRTAKKPDAPTTDAQSVLNKWKKK
ncbi:hypothetical protein EBZ39_06195 [bacterium]|nr:hypothetical protein [bacterium]